MKRGPPESRSPESPPTEPLPPESLSAGDLTAWLHGRAEEMMAARCAGEPIHPEELGTSVEVAGGAGVASHEVATRKGAGAWYTHAVLAEGVSSWVLDPLLRSCPRGSWPTRGSRSGPTVCDPTMGGGAFLLAAFRRILAAFPAEEARDLVLRKEVVERLLFGVDVNPMAVLAARLALWVEVGDPELPTDRFAPNLVHADAILSRRPGTSGPPDNEDLTDFEELFPQVFSMGDSAGTLGFDAVLGNPPWDIKKPNSREFFAAYDPEFRGRERSDADAVRDRILRESPEVRAAWDAHRSAHRDLSRWISDSGQYALMGRGDINSYKLLVERSLDLLRPRGRLGLVVPSGIYADKGTEALRRHLIEAHRLERIYGFENRDGIFDIHRSFRFAAIVVEKGGKTQSIRVAIGQTDLDGLDAPDRVSFQYPRKDVAAFSPHSFQLLEVRNDIEREILQRIHSGRQRVGDRLENGLSYRREFDLTQDADSFVEHGHLVAAGAEFDRLGVASVSSRSGSDALSSGRYLPLLQGVMLRSFDCPAAAWKGGRRTGGRRDWENLPFGAGRRMTARLYVQEKVVRDRSAGSLVPRLAFRDVQNATNERTFLGAIVPGYPCGNTLPTLTYGDLRQDLVLLAILTSFVVDRVLRLKMSQNHVNRFLLEELPVPEIPKSCLEPLIRLSAVLSLSGPWFDEARRDFSDGLDQIGDVPGWVGDPIQRRSARATLDAVVARCFGLSVSDMEVLLADCAHSEATLRPASFRRGLDRKGFWRVDRLEPPEDRHTRLTIARLKALEAAISGGIAPDRAIQELLEDPFGPLCGGFGG